MRCPSCNHEFDMHDLALDQDLRAILAMLPAFEVHQPLVLEYVGMFGTRPLVMKSAKIVRLLAEMKHLFDSGRFTFKRVAYEISRPGIVEAIHTVCTRGSISLPLDGHNYLKKIMIDVSEQERKAKSLEADKQHRQIEKHGWKPAEVDNVMSQDAPGRDGSPMLASRAGSRGSRPEIRPEDAPAGQVLVTKDKIRETMNTLWGPKKC